MKTLAGPPIFLLFSVFALFAPGPALGGSPDAWTPWATRPELMPEARFQDRKEDPCPEWRIQSTGAASCQGGWDLQWKTVAPGQWYRTEISCAARDVPHIHDNAHAELIWWKADGKRADWAHIPFEKAVDGSLLFSHIARAPEDAASATLRLMLRWTDRGSLAWTGPSLTVTGAPPPRKLKAAIATGKFPGESVEANLEFALDLVRQAAHRGAAVVCLPERITTWRLKDEEHLGARPIPGAETDALCAAAKQRGIDIVCSMNERNGDLVHNTGLYIDAKRGIVGKYRKVHLSVGERWKGVTPGDAFPVWETGYGKAGMLICYDNVHAEGHRILAQKGAEVLFLPIMGDPRAIGDDAHENWRRIMQVRAMDNHVWFVVCQNKGEWGMVIRPDGTVAAEVNPESGIAVVELDLDMRFDSTIGSDFKNRNWGERRPHLYEEITEDR